MTYIEMLRYQERTMNAQLCAPWIGFRQDRECFKFALSYMRHVIAKEEERIRYADE